MARRKADFPPSRYLDFERRSCLRTDLFFSKVDFPQTLSTDFGAGFQTRALAKQKKNTKGAYQGGTNFSNAIFLLLMAMAVHHF